jgi:uncharacterized membrane protein YoaK (UPF0700 family)
MLEKDMKTRRIHYSMSAIGGFFGGFAILMHHKILSNAQTSNLLSLAIAILGRNPYDMLLHGCSLLIYAVGIALTVVLPKRTKWDMRYVSLVIDGMSIILIGLMPGWVDDFAAMYPIFFAAAFQWNVFPGADGYVSATIFSTNNVRQLTLSLTHYGYDREKKHLHKAGFYAGTLLAFHIGVAIAYIATRLYGTRGGFAGFLPLAVATFLILRHKSDVI